VNGSSPPARFDAIVVGGGPAGAICAATLARAQLRVALIDRAAAPRYKTCGGGLVWRARRAMEVDLRAAIERECLAAEMRIDGAASFRIAREAPLVTMTMRADLDGLLSAEAARAGAEVIAPCALRGLESASAGLVLHTDRGALPTRYAVAADGALSTLARVAGWAACPRRVAALESEIRVPDADLARFADAALFDVGHPAHGYAWVFPKRRHLSVGCLSVRRREALPLRQALDLYLARLGLERIEQREDHGFLIPIAPRGPVLARDRVLLVGDAAGLADPLTCEGISHAVTSGRLAGHAIARHLERPEEVHAAYHCGLEREILGELRLARMLAGMLYERVKLRLAIFKRSGHPLCECVADVIHGRRSYRELLGRPGNYFRLALTVARGSYAAG
jgi:geranylgeranyl reductase family protein